MRFHTVHGVLKARILKWFAILFSSGSQATGGSYPTPEARGSGREDQPHVQGLVAAPAQEGLEALSQLKVRKGGSEEIPHVQGKKQPLRDTPSPR